jgi:hypothetical protein
MQTIGGSLSDDVLDAISGATGTPAGNLPTPLHDVVDPDALDQFFTGRDTDGKAMFAYKDFTVTVTSDSRVQVTK